MSRNRKNTKQNAKRERIQQRKAAARRTERSTTPRISRFAIILVVSIAAVAGGLAGVARWQAPPDVVRPDSLTNLDEDLAALITKRINAAEADPKNPDPRWRLGLAYEGNQLWRAARAAFENALRLGATEPVHRLHAAIALEQSGDPDGALREYRELAAAIPQFAPVQHRLGDALLQIGALDEAEAAFKRCASHAPQAVEPIVGLADIKLRRKDYPGATSLLEKAVAMDPDYKLSHYLLGLAYRGSGRREDAQRELAAGVDAQKRFMPDSAGRELYESVSGYAAKLNRAGDYISAGKYAQGLKLLNEVLSERPTDTTVLNNLAVVYQKTGDFQKSLNILRRAERADPNYFATYINYVECLLQLKRYDEALAYGRKAARLAPQVGQAQYALGRALLATERFAEAREALLATIRIDTRNPEAFLQLGEACIRLNQLSEAKEYLKTAVQRMPNLLRAHVNLAAVLLELGEENAAARAIETAQRIAPGHPRVVALENRLATRRNQ